ncbi:hypothetical protein F4814DRAFT_438190 [Daldinia grandis]|nr:hypothetical protein F4814DRAFT_438190 [Daldinia grandis]
MTVFDLDRTERIRGQLVELKVPEAPPSLSSKELQYFWDRGNKRRPLPPNPADNTKALVMRLDCNNRGLAESLARYLMRRTKSRIRALSTIRLYLRQLSAIYRKYKAVSRLELSRIFGLRQEPKHKKVLDPSGFTYLAHFRWVRDSKTRFKIGLDRLDDSLIRDFLMWTGCRRHELVYAQPKNKKEKIKEYDRESDAYTDIDEPDPYILPRPKECWLCGGVDERTDAQYKVICWEDIDLWILHDPMRNGGRDHLAMQVLLRFHKGHNKEIVSTWFSFIEEKLLAKAISEGVIDLAGYDTRAELYFGTNISIPAVYIPWKNEFWHKPVFRKTVKSVEGPIKSDEPLKEKAFDDNSERLGKVRGLPDRFQSYVYQRGILEILDKNYRQLIRDQVARHRLNSAIYQRYYANAIRNAIFQDAGLGRGTESPYLTILNHLGPDNTIRQLEREYNSTSATGDDHKMRKQKANELRAARQRWRRKVAGLLRKDHFEGMNKTELDRQLRGIHEPQQPLQKVIFSLPERRLLAEILGDLDGDIPEADIVQRKVDAINAWINYACKTEPKELATKRCAPSRAFNAWPNGKA